MINKILLSLRIEKTEKMELHYDKPISKYEADSFDRKQIADKLAAFIKHRSLNLENDSFCIGVYGKWGEGKTSLANMTIDKLKQNKSDNIVISQYNPWLLKDQESILYDFFNTISDDDLGAKTIKFLKEYGAIVSLGLEGVLGLAGVPLVGKAASFSLNKIVKALPNSKQSVSELKKKVNESIKASGKHLVVFVDDLDRLDNEEIHAVLKLIRQNTDFVNTTYILMMDYDIVSSSLQAKYGDGNKYAGQEFLSKIVQFPLHLPQIQERHLDKFLFERLDGLFSSLNANDKIYNDTIEKAKSDIRNFVLPLFSTPREIIQYINILSFVVPTMYKELNLSDLCLLEAVKKFSYECYKEIRDNKYVLLDIRLNVSYVIDVLESRKKVQNNIKEEKLKIVDGICSLQKNEYINSIIKYLLEDFVQDRQRNENVYKNRLCNINFFDKYFIYDTPVDIISEQFIDDIETAIKNNEEDYVIELFNKIQNDFRNGEVGRIVRKLIDKTIQYSPDKIDDVSTNISMVLSKMEISNRIGNSSLQINGHYELIIFQDIFNKLYTGNYDNQDRNYPLIKSIIKKIYEEGGLMFSVYMDKEYCNYNYLNKEYKELFEILIRRFIKEKGELEIFIFQDYRIRQSLILGYSNYLRDEYIKTRDRVMQDKNLDIVRLIYGFVMGKQEKEIVAMEKYFDTELLYNKVKDIYLTGDYKGYKEYIEFFIQEFQKRNKIISIELKA